MNKLIKGEPLTCPHYALQWQVREAQEKSPLRPPGLLGSGLRESAAGSSPTAKAWVGTFPPGVSARTLQLRKGISSLPFIMCGQQQTLSKNAVQTNRTEIESNSPITAAREAQACISLPRIVPVMDAPLYHGLHSGEEDSLVSLWGLSGVLCCLQWGCLFRGCFWGVGKAWLGLTILEAP